jgi:hypothetical protein
MESVYYDVEEPVTTGDAATSVIVYIWADEAHKIPVTLNSAIVFIELEGRTSGTSWINGRDGTSNADVVISDTNKVTLPMTALDTAMVNPTGDKVEYHIVTFKITSGTRVHIEKTRFRIEDPNSGT